MADRDFTPDQQRLLALYDQFIALSDDSEVAGRFIFLGPDGAIVANGALSARDIDAATLALTSLNDAKAATQESTAPALYDAMPKVQIDPVLEAELEEYCIGLDATHLVEMAAEDRAAAVAAFDEITSDLNEDGGPA